MTIEIYNMINIMQINQFLKRSINIEEINNYKVIIKIYINHIIANKIIHIK